MHAQLQCFKNVPTNLLLPQATSGIATRRGRLSTVDLLIKVDCFAVVVVAGNTN